MKELTKEQVNKKYFGKYVEIGERYDYQERKSFYTIHKTSKVIRENMTLGQDVGTDLAYRR